ncbi:hypothetical protein [Rhodoferax sp. OV413]|uniref:hypothetical protein n=1 Tax=Rhodoferax sp. OV413 TaxID=1855285 RepID=UPI00115FAC55|nr:hypothetical protein [Rhodoferax sp. OV413]
MMLALVPHESAGWHSMLCGFSSGYFTGFIEKIIFLGNGDWNDSFRKPPPGDDFDQPEVVVSRK